MLQEKFDRFQIWSNIIQHVATYRNRVAKRTQHVVPNNVARCCVEMLRAFCKALKIKHLMTGLKGKIEFCFPETLNVPRGEVQVVVSLGS